MITDLQLLDAAADAYTLPATIETADTHVVISQVDGVTVIAFRGSTAPIDFLRDGEIVPIYDGQLGIVHGGFLGDVEHIFDQLHISGPVAITGHSKGGAEAQLLAGLLTANGAKPVRLTTFGAPRVCWGQVFDRLSGLIGSIPGEDYRNGLDPVPEVPVEYHHPRQVIQIGQTHPWWAVWRWWGDKFGISYHMLEAYRASLEAIRYEN